MAETATGVNARESWRLLQERHGTCKLIYDLEFLSAKTIRALGLKALDAKGDVLRQDLEGLCGRVIGQLR